MKRGPKRFLHASTLLIGLTGLIWAWMRYVWSAGPEPEDPELMMTWTGIHPKEPLMRTLHLLAAPLSVFAVGIVWQGHVAPRLGKRRYARRYTGHLLAGLFFPMVISGVLLQTASSEEMRNAMVYTHAISGSAWFFFYGAHLRSQLPWFEGTKPGSVPPKTLG